MSNNLKQQAVSGAKWNMLLNFGRYFITFFLSIILARLLDPEEFGLIGMLTIFTSIAQVFINSGLATALIRAKDVSSEDYSTVFYFNIVVSSFFYVLLYFTAPLISDFYGESELIPLTRLVSLVFLINSFGLIQNAILVKEINFKNQALCNLAGLIVSVIVSAILAFNGFGVYSIAWQAVSQAFITNLLFWVTSKWRPNSGFSLKSFKKLWSFGSKILSTTIVAKIIDNIDNIIIGKMFSAGQLGYYVRAKSTKQLPEQIFTSVLSSTSFAVLSKVNDDDNELRRLHLHFFKLSSYFFFPIVFGFIAVAEAFIVVLYSDKWLPSVPLFQIIGLASISYFLSALFSQTIMAKGDGTLYFRLNAGKKLLGLLTIPFGIWGGLYQFIIAFVCINIIGLFLDIFFTSRLLNIRITQYLKAMKGSLLISIIMGSFVYLIGEVEFGNYVWVLCVQMISGISIYVFLSRLFRFEAFFYLLDVGKQQVGLFIGRFKRK
jgi:teichuronic acid exporter